MTGRLDAAVAVLFVMMVFWQLGHFYAIAMFRRDDYAAAGLPVWSVAKGLASTKRQLFLFVWMFLLSAPLLTLLGYTGVMYAVAMTGVGLIWVVNGFRKYSDDVAWSRRMFFVSLTVLLTMCLLITIGGFLP
jgi:protoheme IX farnesyltransferase